MACPALHDLVCHWVEEMRSTRFVNELGSKFWDFKLPAGRSPSLSLHEILSKISIMGLYIVYTCVTHVYTLFPCDSYLQNVCIYMHTCTYVPCDAFRTCPCALWHASLRFEVYDTCISAQSSCPKLGLGTQAKSAVGTCFFGQNSQSQA